MAQKQLIVGNWKMNNLDGRIKPFTDALNFNNGTCDVVICPPFINITEIVDCGIVTGAQDCHTKPYGAYTGNISPNMLKHAGCDYVILGHSERRTYEKESNSLIKQKAEAAHNAGLITIICIGETLDERDNGKTLEVLAYQMQHSIPETANSKNTIIAYEPVWAIGTGRVASLKQIEEVHGYIHHFITEEFNQFTTPMCILYGGSVKGDNAKDILAVNNVGGALVGGASLDVDSFNDIIGAAYA